MRGEALPNAAPLALSAPVDSDAPQAPAVASLRAELAAQDDYLDQQLRGLQRLGALGGLLASESGKQCDQVSEIDWRVERLRDETRAQIRMQVGAHEP